MKKKCLRKLKKKMLGGSSVASSTLNGFYRDIGERYPIANMLSTHFTFSMWEKHEPPICLFFPIKSALKEPELKNKEIKKTT